MIGTAGAAEECGSVVLGAHEVLHASPSGAGPLLGGADGVVVVAQTVVGKVQDSGTAGLASMRSPDSCRAVMIEIWIACPDTLRERPTEI